MKMIIEDKYLIKILKIIAYTNVPIIILGYWILPQALGWFLGSLASAIRLIWLYDNVSKTLILSEKKAKIAAAKGYYLRFFSLIVYAVTVVYFIKPDIVMFGMGLLAGQLAIFINAIKERFYPE